MKKLFEMTSDIRGLELKNRFVRSATWEWMAEDSGHMNDRLMTVYENLAKGGVGAIITGYAFVLEDEQPNPKMMGIYDDSFIEDYKPLVEMVHGHDCKIILQIVYGGSFTLHDVGERVIWGPSAVANKPMGTMSTEMTKADIDKLVNAFGDASLRAKQAGFDGVELHGAHGYLLNQFLAPYYNRREDEYGGSTENRARIIHEVYDNVREKVGEDYPVLIKLNCSDFMGDKGVTFAETLSLCRDLDRKGIHAVEISGGPVFKAPKPEKDPTKEVVLDGRDSYFAEYARDIASKINTPVILVGGNRSTEKMEKILNESEISCFSLSRPLLSEPDLINKWKADPDLKPRCVSCGKCFDPSGNMCIFDREKEKKS